MFRLRFAKLLILLSITYIKCETKVTELMSSKSNKRFGRLSKDFQFPSVDYFAEIYKALQQIPNVILDPAPVTLEGIIGKPSLENIVDYQIGLRSGDPELNFTQLVTKHGYPVETHRVLTDDGYILTIFRIPSNGTPVLLQHGLIFSSDDWIVLGPKKGLGYLLANEGYDVWLSNSRGNKHSLSHVHLNPNGEEFWDFSWDEIGRYDVPAVIDYILKVSGREKLQYIGHSQGTTVFFVMCSERPEYNKKISFMIALAPAAWMKNIKSPVLRIKAPIGKYRNSLASQIVGTTFLEMDSLPIIIKQAICEGNFYKQFICITFRSLTLGFDKPQLDFKALPIIIRLTPSISATKQLRHYAQSIVDGKFRRYDYKSYNKVVYGSEKPPEYPVEKITVPMAFFYSRSDWAVATEDIKTLLDRLKNSNVTLFKIPSKGFTHLDFIFAKDIVKLVYKNVLKVLRDHN